MWRSIFYVRAGTRSRFQRHWGVIVIMHVCLIDQIKSNHQIKSNSLTTALTFRERQWTKTWKEGSGKEFQIRGNHWVNTGGNIWRATTKRPSACSWVFAVRQSLFSSLQAEATWTPSTFYPCWSAVYGLHGSGWLRPIVEGKEEVGDRWQKNSFKRGFGKNRQVTRIHNYWHNWSLSSNHFFRQLARHPTSAQCVLRYFHVAGIVNIIRVKSIARLMFTQK